MSFSPLITQLMTDAVGVPLENRSGRLLFRLATDLIYATPNRQAITVPEGFLTDFASVPRLPVIYLSLGDIAHAPAVLHDWLYAMGIFPRKVADEILFEAMKATGVSWAKRWAIYCGVRLCGGAYYNDV